jgi:hypothetical protein
MFATEAILSPKWTTRLRAGLLKEAEQESKHWVNSQLDFKEYLTRRGIQEGSIQQVRGSVALSCSADQFGGALPNTT